MKKLHKKRNLQIFKKRDFWIFVFNNFLIMFIILLISLLIVFKIFLPLYTRHGKEIMVPNLKGIHFSEAKKKLNDIHLRIHKKDQNSYSIEFLPNAILYQDPSANTYVKKNRTIYVSLNALEPPLIKMPNVLNGSKRNAELILKASDLKLGNIIYISDISLNCVLAQKYKNKIIDPGIEIPKGSKIDLVIGAGLSKKKILTPNLIGKSRDEAIKILQKKGLHLGAVIYEDMQIESDSELEENIIHKQIPSPEEKIYLGNVIDVWIYSNILNKN